MNPAGVGRCRSTSVCHIVRRISPPSAERRRSSRTERVSATCHIGGGSDWTTGSQPRNRDRPHHREGRRAPTTVTVVVSHSTTAVVTAEQSIQKTHLRVSTDYR